MSSLYSHPTRKTIATLFVVFLLIASVASAAVTPPQGTPKKSAKARYISTIDLPTSYGFLLDKAISDECYNGIGQPYPAGPPCGAGQPKTNQAYIWGLAKVGNDIWMGTMANTECLVLGNYIGATTPFETSSMVCEFGSSQLSLNPPNLPAKIGDFRPPHIYVFNLATQARTEKVLTGAAALALSRTLGIRAAGAFNNVVLLAGPSLTGGINVFAFQADTGAFLGVQNLPVYNNIRKFVVIGGALYTGVGMPNTLPPNPLLPTGRVLRWTGSVASPFTFDEVGILDSMASELAEHQGRIYVTSWPDSEIAAGSKIAGLYMSPTIPGPGFVAPPTAWTKVWSATDYEPDPITAATYGGGALASWQGSLYWGTMHVPLLSTLAHRNAYLAEFPSDPAAQFTWFTNSERAIGIFRGQNLDTTPTIELLYGTQTMQVYVSGTGWVSTPNNMGGVTPLFLLPGMGNIFNNYTWTMDVFDNRLWVGTMDWGEQFSALLPSFLPGVTIPADLVPPPQTFGADLYQFLSPDAPAIPETYDGFANAYNYGIRTTLVDATDLFLGTANPSNLRTNPSQPSLGGWELIQLKAKPPNTPSGDGVVVTLNTGATVTFCHVDDPGYTISYLVPLTPAQISYLVPPPGYAAPSRFYIIGSTANWRNCPSGALAHVCVPRTSATSHLFQLTIDPTLGPIFQEITSSANETTICGAIATQTIGIIAELDEIPPVPALSIWSIAALIGLCALAGAIAIRRLL